MTTKPQYCWAIYSGKMLLPWTCKQLRKDCVVCFLDDCNATWKQTRKRGYSVHKIKVTVIK